MSNTDNVEAGAEPAGATGQAVTGVSLKLPPFWANDPAIWFAQIEAQFSTKGITQEQTKFSHVISALQPDVATEVRDLLLNPPAPKDKPYTILKAELIRRTSASEQKRLNKLLISEELGDRTPSQLIRRMQQLLGDKQLEPSILKQLFVQRLPMNVQLILASTSDTMSINDLAALADKIVEVASPSSVASVTSDVPTPQASHSQPPSSALADDMQRLTAQVAQLTTQMQTLSAILHQGQGQGNRQSRSRSRSGNRRDSSRSPRRQSEQRHPDSECWYHWKFGEKAKKCETPCSWQRRHPTSSSENDHAHE